MFFMDRIRLQKNNYSDTFVKTQHRRFELDYIAVSNGQFHKLHLNNHYNILSDKHTQNIPYSLEEMFSFVKFCLTGKNDNSGHLREKGVEFIETAFYSINNKYIIRIFAEHQYKAFMFKIPTISISEREIAQKINKQLIGKFTGLGEIHNNMLPLIKSILNIPEHITLPQFFRLFFLHHKYALHRLISDSDYQKMTTTLINYILNKEVSICEHNSERLINLFSITENENVFIDYSIKFIQDKLDRLDKQKNIKIDSLKSYYRKNIKRQFSDEIRKLRNEFTEYQKETTITKRKIYTLRKLLRAKKYKEDIEQFTLFKETDYTQNEETIKGQLTELEHHLSNLKFKQNYLHLTSEELQSQKQKQIELYREELMGIVANFEDAKLQERINLEILLEQRKQNKDSIKQKEYSKQNISKKTIEVLENSINKYIEITELNYSIKLGDNNIPFIITSQYVGIELDRLSNKEKSLISISFHLGLMDFSLNYGNSELLPQFMLFNISEEEHNMGNLMRIINFFRKSNESYSFQLILIHPQKMLTLV